MSELNHELDRDNLNKAHVESEKPLGGLSFPSKSEHYERGPNAPQKTGWDAFADAVKGAHHDGSLGMYFEKIS
jgi:hypothetical protein